MKFCSGALSVIATSVFLAAHIEYVSGFSANPRNGIVHQRNLALHVSANRDTLGRSREEIEKELSSGVALDGGPVIDFGSVKDQTSKAEKALAMAREHYEASGRLIAHNNDRLMGINDEVTAEMGREVGQFSNSEEVQGCAQYLRAMAVEKGLFASSPSVPTPPLSQFSEQQKRAYEALLDKAYEESGAVTEAFAKTFYLGTQLMPVEARKAIWAVYVWCRRTDEIVDAPRENDDEMLTDLSAWEIRLEELFQYGKVEDVLDLCLLECKIKYPSMPIEPYMDMIRGMLMDIPDLGQDRYETFDELHLYCYRVAGTVGLMSMPVFGCAPGFTEAQAKEPALSLGVAFQITNILRDVGEDATTRGRVYLPRADMERYGVTEEQIMAQRVDQNYINLMKHEIARARMYYQRAKSGVPMLSEFSRLPVQSALDCYGKILDKIEENGYDTLNKRAYVGKWEKSFEIPFSYYRTLEIANTLPLPWDQKFPSELPEIDT